MLMSTPEHKPCPPGTSNGTTRALRAESKRETSRDVTLAGEPTTSEALKLYYDSGDGLCGIGAGAGDRGVSTRMGDET